MEGAGGVILRPKNQREIQFSWGLGSMKNNQNKSVALYKVLEIIIAKGIHQVMVF